MVSIHLVDGAAVRVRAVAGPGPGRAPGPELGPIDTDLEGRRVALSTWERLLAEREQPGGPMLTPMRTPDGALVGVIAAEPTPRGALSLEAGPSDAQPPDAQPPGDRSNASSTTYPALRRAIVRLIAAQTGAGLTAASQLATLRRDRDRLLAQEAVLRRLVEAAPSEPGLAGAAIPEQRGTSAATTAGVRDPVTGMLDRRATLRRLAEYIAGERNPTRPGAAVHLVLSGLPDEGDAAKVDAILLAISRRIAGVLRRSDIPGRLGNGVFLLIIPGLGETGATQLAVRVRAVIEAPISLDGRTYPVAARIRVVPLTAAISLADVLSSRDPTAPATALRSTPATSPRTSP